MLSPQHSQSLIPEKAKGKAFGHTLSLPLTKDPFRTTEKCSRVAILPLLRDEKRKKNDEMAEAASLSPSSGTATAVISPSEEKGNIIAEEREKGTSFLDEEKVSPVQGHKERQQTREIRQGSQKMSAAEIEKELQDQLQKEKELFYTHHNSSKERASSQRTTGRVHKGDNSAFYIDLPLFDRLVRRSTEIRYSVCSSFWKQVRMYLALAHEEQGRLNHLEEEKTDGSVATEGQEKDTQQEVEKEKPNEKMINNESTTPLSGVATARSMARMTRRGNPFVPWLTTNEFVKSHPNQYQLLELFSILSVEFLATKFSCAEMDVLRELEHGCQAGLVYKVMVQACPQCSSLIEVVSYEKNILFADFFSKQSEKEERNQQRCPFCEQDFEFRRLDNYFVGYKLSQDVLSLPILRAQLPFHPCTFFSFSGCEKEEKKEEKGNEDAEKDEKEKKGENSEETNEKEESEPRNDSTEKTDSDTQSQVEEQKSSPRCVFSTFISDPPPFWSITGESSNIKEKGKEVCSGKEPVADEEEEGGKEKKVLPAGHQNHPSGGYVFSLHLAEGEEYALVCPDNNIFLPFSVKSSASFPSSESGQSRKKTGTAQQQQGKLPSFLTVVLSRYGYTSIDDNDTKRSVTVGKRSTEEEKGKLSLPSGSIRLRILFRDEKEKGEGADGDTLFLVEPTQHFVAVFQGILNSRSEFYYPKEEGGEKGKRKNDRNKENDDEYHTRVGRCRQNNFMPLWYYLHSLASLRSDQLPQFGVYSRDFGGTVAAHAEKEPLASSPSLASKKGSFSIATWKVKKHVSLNFVIGFGGGCDGEMSSMRRGVTELVRSIVEAHQGVVLASTYYRIRNELLIECSFSGDLHTIQRKEKEANGKENREEEAEDVEEEEGVCAGIEAMSYLHLCTFSLDELRERYHPTAAGAPARKHAEVENNSANKNKNKSEEEGEPEEGMNDQKSNHSAENDCPVQESGGHFFPWVSAFLHRPYRYVDLTSFKFKENELKIMAVVTTSKLHSSLGDSGVPLPSPPPSPWTSSTLRQHQQEPQEDKDGHTVGCRKKGRQEKEVEDKNNSSVAHVGPLRNTKHVDDLDEDHLISTLIVDRSSFHQQYALYLLSMASPGELLVASPAHHHHCYASSKEKGEESGCVQKKKERGEDADNGIVNVPDDNKPGMVVEPEQETRKRGNRGQLLGFHTAMARVLHNEVVECERREWQLFEPFPLSAIRILPSNHRHGAEGEEQN